MSKTETLSIDLLRLDGGSQARIKSSEETIETYAELIDANKGEWPFGPLDVFHDGSDYFLADGFHRTLAALRLNRASLPCRIHKGTSKDAKIFGMTANDKHGFRMSQADKRACVEWLLDNWPKMTQVEIAEKAGVNERTVKRVVADRKPPKGTLSPLLSKTLGKSSEADDAKAAKDKMKADAAAEKQKAKDAAAVAKAEAAAEKARLKLEAAGARQKLKDDAAEAKAEAKALKEAAKAAALTTEGQAKNIANLIQQHIDKAVRLVDDLAHLRPTSNATKMAVIKALQGVRLW